MKSLKPLHWAGLTLGVALALFAIYSHLGYFRNVSFLGGMLLIEVIIASLWKYEQRFIVLLMVVFAWAGMNVPLQSAGTIGRWVVLASGAAVGFIIWTRAPQASFRSMHLIAFFCVSAAFVSATVSSFTQMASLKALSLLLLFMYCSSGARLAAAGRENRFFPALLIGIEITVYGTAICYFLLGTPIWGNPNSLGAAMSVICYPILLWGWLAGDGPLRELRRLTALILCSYLILFSMARAGIVAMVIVTLVLFLGLHQHRLLAKTIGMVLALVAVTGMLAPGTLNRSLGSFKDAVLYKGHKDAGILGSRRTPWEKSLAEIKEHPLFGTGYGTSPTGEEAGVYLPNFTSSAETEREHGSSYVTIAEWVGLLGVMPFVVLLALTLGNLRKVCVWMNRTADPRHYSIPIAMVVLSGLVHANFEDWLFAAGSYLSLFFWVCAFLLADMVPDKDAIASVRAARRSSRPMLTNFGAVAPNR